MRVTTTLINNKINLAEIEHLEEWLQLGEDHKLQVHQDQMQRIKYQLIHKEIRINTQKLKPQLWLTHMIMMDLGKIQMMNEMILMKGITKDKMLDLDLPVKN